MTTATPKPPLMLRTSTGPPSTGYYSSLFPGSYFSPSSGKDGLNLYSTLVDNDGQQPWRPPPPCLCSFLGQETYYNLDPLDPPHHEWRVTIIRIASIAQRAISLLLLCIALRSFGTQKSESFSLVKQLYPYPSDVAFALFFSLF